MNKIIIEGLIKIKQAVRELGLHNDDKNAQFGAFASEAKLIETFDKAVKKVQEREKDFTATVITLPATVGILPDHQRQVAYKDKYGNEKNRFMTGVIVSFTYFIYVNGDSYQGVFQMSGEDDNDMSFAAGKAATYGKRIFLLKLMDLTSAGLDPERVENKREREQEAPKPATPAYTGRPSRSPEAKAALKEGEIEIKDYKAEDVVLTDPGKEHTFAENVMIEQCEKLSNEKPDKYEKLAKAYTTKYKKELKFAELDNSQLKTALTFLEAN